MVDRLIHDLGAVRAFVDEAEAMVETAGGPQVVEVRTAMDEAADAIGHLFSRDDQAVVEAAWEAVAHAQDAVAKARAVITAVRSSREAARQLGEVARLQRQRAREQAQVIADQGQRLHHGEAAATKSPERSGEGD
jgi:hypothetical protein